MQTSDQTSSLLKRCSFISDTQNKVSNQEQKKNPLDLAILEISKRFIEKQDANKLGLLLNVPVYEIAAAFEDNPKCHDAAHEILQRWRATVATEEKARELLKDALIEIKRPGLAKDFL